MSIRPVSLAFFTTLSLVWTFHHLCFNVCTRCLQHGDGAVYWAARQGHVGVIQYLHNQGVNVDTQNKVKI